jgi:peptidoglycan/LPS O-acetylase OafA/YrhL
LPLIEMMLKSWDAVAERIRQAPGTILPENNLDLLRAMAVLAVLVCHFVLSWKTSESLYALGRMGVYAFFVHTSFVLMSSIERLIAQRRSTREWIHEFYAKRLLRIYPLAIVSIFVVTLGDFPFDTEMLTKGIAEPSSWTIFTNVLLVQNLFDVDSVLVVLWTLPLEVQMYAVLPLCFMLQQKGWKWLAACLGLAVAGGAAYLLAGDVPFVWRLSLLAYTPCFMAGVLGFYLSRVTVWKPFLPAWGWPLALVAWSAFAVWGYGLSGRHIERAWVFCLGIAILISLFKNSRATTSIRAMRATNGESATAGHVVLRSAHVIAKYSYGIYLAHMIAIAVVWRGCERSGLVLLAVVAVVVLIRSRSINLSAAATVAIMAALWWRTPSEALDLPSVVLFIGLLTAFAAAGYHFVEAPFIRLGKRVSPLAAGPSRRQLAGPSLSVRS